MDAENMKCPICSMLVDFTLKLVNVPGRWFRWGRCWFSAWARCRRWFRFWRSVQFRIRWCSYLCFRDVGDFRIRRFGWHSRRFLWIWRRRNDVRLRRLWVRQFGWRNRRLRMIWCRRNVRLRWFRIGWFGRRRQSFRGIWSRWNIRLRCFRISLCWLLLIWRRWNLIRLRWLLIGWFQWNSQSLRGVCCRRFVRLQCLGIGGFCWHCQRLPMIYCRRTSLITVANRFPYCENKKMKINSREYNLVRNEFPFRSSHRAYTGTCFWLGRVSYDVFYDWCCLRSNQLFLSSNGLGFYFWHVCKLFVKRSLNEK